MDLSLTTLIVVAIVVLVLFAWAYFDSHGPNHI
jgi:hypothetical protein